ncbi:DUF2306 domain-containing protein [Galbibacter mesophilus]|uniref:DUF2306 domain-containing protein n=1 Tax=Galbibacter mesophilus TaxID=379069 RepID=UPI00191F5FE7|nr:DUF2306 domain-containing protein [Galbibacter mesophilus]MCM5663231.1 DUF2306 domain-containing protein [Galbibacter mesophilus]
MKTLARRSIWVLFAFMCIGIGLYPIIYFLIDGNFGLLLNKTPELLADQIWNIAFYGHITLGGLASLIGWMQFSSKLRRRNIKLHRNIGKIYIFAVLISGTCGAYIAQFATGGISNSIGFTLSGLVWLSTTALAYNAIVKGKIREHQNFMIYSYAVCFSAVTLRIWLPALTAILGEFRLAYLIVGWLSWVPNLVVAYFIIKKIHPKPYPQQI